MSDEMTEIGILENVRISDENQNSEKCQMLWRTSGLREMADTGNRFLENVGDRNQFFRKGLSPVTGIRIPEDVTYQFRNNNFDKCKIQ